MTTKEDQVLLGVAPPYTSETLRAAWQQLATKHHPDHGGDPELFARARVAYKRLQQKDHRPVCVACSGLGSRPMVSGWYTIWVKCKKCKGEVK